MIVNIAMKAISEKSGCESWQRFRCLYNYTYHTSGLLVPGSPPVKVLCTNLRQLHTVRGYTLSADFSRLPLKCIRGKECHIVEIAVEQ